MFYRVLFSGLLLVSAAGCRTGLPVRSDTQALTELVLNREIRIPPRHARALFQKGRQADRVSSFDPYCEFEIDTVSERGLPVAADRFLVTRVVRRMVGDELTGMPPVIGHMFGGEDIYYETHLWLVSERQPGVRKLICRRWSKDLGRGGYLTAAGIRATLGSDFDLK